MEDPLSDLLKELEDSPSLFVTSAIRRHLRGGLRRGDMVLISTPTVSKAFPHGYVSALGKLKEKVILVNLEAPNIPIIGEDWRFIEYDTVTVKASTVDQRANTTTLANVVDELKKTLDKPRLDWYRDFEKKGNKKRRF